MNRWVGSLTFYTAPTSCRNLSLVSTFLQSLLFLLVVLAVTVTPHCLLVFVIHAVLYIGSCPYCPRSLVETQGFHASRNKKLSRFRQTKDLLFLKFVLCGYRKLLKFIRLKIQTSNLFLNTCQQYAARVEGILWRSSNFGALHTMAGFKSIEFIEKHPFHKNNPFCVRNSLRHRSLKSRRLFGEKSGCIFTSS